MIAIIYIVKKFQTPMKVSREQALKNRDKVLLIASRILRERGFHGMSINEVMAEAGLTHGAFYKQFNSKEDLIAQACALALEQNLEDYRSHVKETRKSPLDAIADGVLNLPHRDSPGLGCVMAALGPEISRTQDPLLRQSVTQGVKHIVEWVGRALSGKPKKPARQQALAAYATMVGALMLSRAVDDPVLSKRFLKAAISAIKTGE